MIFYFGCELIYLLFIDKRKIPVLNVTKPTFDYFHQNFQIFFPKPLLLNIQPQKQEQ